MSTLCWIRRDLRLHDHKALSEALSRGETSIVFIFDSHILDALKNKHDRRVTFIYQSLVEIEKELQKHGSSLFILYGKPEEEIPKLAEKLKVSAVMWNRDYEPYAKKRDAQVAKKLKTLGIESQDFKDTVFFEKQEVLKNDGGIYKVFTPYKNKWLELFEKSDRQVPEYRTQLKNLKQHTFKKNILDHNWYQEIGFHETLPPLPGGRKEGLKRLKKFSEHIDSYDKARDFPALHGTSLLSVHLRHGTVSVREMIKLAEEHSSSGARTWLSEIIWRDFYQMILDAFPRVVKEAFKPEYDELSYPGGETEFKAWCEGQTGYPIVDAAMRQLNATGMIHNRLRMVVASFLCKVLLVHWRKGEAYFAEKLLDYDLASNNGGWQWSSSSGCDAQPYFRIFNPYTQSEKFDHEGKYIHEWIPELRHLKAKDLHHPSPLLAPDYPAPIVNYEQNRKRALIMFEKLKKS